MAWPPVTHQDVEDEVGLVRAEAGRLLAVRQYFPTTSTTYATSSATVTDVDPTNLSVTFTVPASGAVIVTLSALFDTTTNTGYQWGLREGTTVLGLGLVDMIYAVPQLSGRGHLRMRLAGLTPGATPTWKWAHARPYGTTSQMHAGQAAGATANARGPALMEVWSA